MEDFQVPPYIGRYRVIKILGHGMYSLIAIGIDEKQQEIFAIKVFNRELVNELGMMKYIESELRLLSKISHPSFPQIYDMIFDPKYIAVVMEYLPNGNIIDFTLSCYRFSMKEKLEVCLQILEGIEYLHERDIAHRDIKPENIVFDYNMKPKIIDFGMSQEKQDCTRTYCGTPNYMAPEIITKGLYDGKKADIWSFAVTAHVLITQESPIHFSSESKYVKCVKSGTLQIFNQITGEVGDTFNQCLSINPDDRPTASELVQRFRQFLNKESKLKTTKSTNKFELPPLKHANIMDRSKTGKNLNFYFTGKNPMNYRLRKACSL